MVDILLQKLSRDRMFGRKKNGDKLKTIADPCATRSQKMVKKLNKTEMVKESR